MVFVTFLGVALLASYFAAQTGRQTDQAVAQPGKSRSFMRSDEDSKSQSPYGTAIHFVRFFVTTSGRRP